MGLLDARKTPPDAELYGQVAGEYRIVKKLGSGGFGAVYEAEHPVLKRRAAVKVLHESRSVDQAAVARFIAEAQSASQIKHRHIVDIFSFGKLAGGRHFYVMDLLDGATLDRYLKERKVLPPQVALPLLGPIAGALDALHSAGIIHRDVKPPNIFLAWESNGEVVPKLLDFGLVKLLADSPVHTASGVPMGTPYYMAPEQCRGEKIDARADVYAFGVICHELLTGQRPFTGDTPTSVLVAHLVKTPPKMSEVRHELPTELDAPVLNMLEKDVEARPASVGAAFAALEQAARRAGIELPSGPLKLPRPELDASNDEPPRTGSSDIALRSTARPTTRQAGDDGVSGSTANSARSLRLLLVAGGILFALAAVFSLYFLRPRAPVAAEAPPDVSSSPVAAPSENQSPSAARAAPPASVELRLRGAPPEAEVRLGDRPLGGTEAPIRLPHGTESVELTVSAPGHEPRQLRVVPNASLELDASLVPIQRTPKSAPPKPAAPKAPPTPKDLENPF